MLMRGIVPDDQLSRTGDCGSLGIPWRSFPRFRPCASQTSRARPCAAPVPSHTRSRTSRAHPRCSTSHARGPARERARGRSKSKPGVPGGWWDGEGGSRIFPERYYPDSELTSGADAVSISEQKANTIVATLPLLPDAKPKLVGIARLAADGESLRQGHDVEYFTLPVRSLLNRCSGVRMPFTWTINPYRGCEFGCKYCYARYTHEFMEMREGEEFEQKIYVKQHAADLLRQELRRVKPGEEIAIGTATDPYQPAEKRYEVTRGILEELAKHHGLELGLITKSNLVLRDVELFKAIAQHNRMAVTITVTTMDSQLARILEPRAPRPDLRMEAVCDLNAAGVDAGVSCSPVLPGINDASKELEKVVRAAAKAKAKHIFANPLFLKPCSAAVFLPFLEKEFPHLTASYRQRYAERAFLPRAYGKEISELIARLRQKYGIVRQARHQKEAAIPEVEGQMELF
jgi:DNA repair photolyase